MDIVNERAVCKDDHQSGNGAYPGVVKKLFY